MVEKAWDYVWSSARTHVGIDKDPIIKTVGCKQILDQLGGKVTWKDYLCNIDATVDEAIRTSTYKGYVIGSEDFAHQMEQEMGIKLTPVSLYRP